MPPGDSFEAPQGTPLHTVQFRAISEGLADTGVRAPNDLAVTAGSGPREVDVASGTAYYDSTAYDYSGASPAVTLSAGDVDDARVDTVAFDTGSTSVIAREGTPDPAPTPPTLQAGEVLLAVVTVPAGATDIGDQLIRNWRAVGPTQASRIIYADATDSFGVTDVAAALNELQEAAQLGAYPVGAPDLDTPLGLDDVSDLDVGTADLTANDGSTMIYDAGNSEVPAARLGGPASSLSTYPLAFATDTDADLASTDLTAAGGTTTVFDATAGVVPRRQVDRDRVVASVASANHTTGGEEIVLVDTVAIGGGSTVTLASADATEGAAIAVVDRTGGASGATITVDTEGSETLNGSNSITVDTDYGAARLISDGSNWVTAGGGTGGGGGVTIEDGQSVVQQTATAVSAGEALSASSDGDGTAEVDLDSSRVVGGEATANLSDTNQLVVDRFALTDGGTVRVRKCSLTVGVSGPAPTDVDLKLVTFDGSGSFTTQTVLIDGDGSTDSTAVTGDPVGTYENTSGGDQTVGVVADNQSGTNHELFATTRGVID
jgi:hypothetical protein